MANGHVMYKHIKWHLCTCVCVCVYYSTSVAFFIEQVDRDNVSHHCSHDGNGMSRSSGLKHCNCNCNDNCEIESFFGLLLSSRIKRDRFLVSVKFASFGFFLSEDKNAASSLSFSFEFVRKDNDLDEKKITAFRN